MCDRVCVMFVVRVFVCCVLHTCVTHTHLRAAELKKRYDLAAKKKCRRNGVVSNKGIDCSLKEHRARWKKMDAARLVGGRQGRVS